MTESTALTVPYAVFSRARWATMWLFFMAGACYATWGVHIPTIRDKFGLSAGALSMAMFAMAAGAITVMKPVGRWVARQGSARAAWQAGLVYAAAVALIMVAPSFWLLIPVLVLFAIGNTGYDVAMNAHAATVEASAPKPVMAQFHGMFSLGGMVGASVGGVLIKLGVPPLLHCAGMAALILLTIWWAHPRMQEDHPVAPAKAGQHHIGRVLWLLGLLAFLGLIAEGAMYDWTVIYLRDVAHSAELASMAYATFSGGMALGRFGGDALRARFGMEQLLKLSGWVGFAGIALAVALPWPATSLLGFTLMGLGCANLVPLFFLAASRLPGISPAEAIADVARLAYVGLLLGPVLIGMVTQHSNLRWGMLVVAIAIGWIAVDGARVLRKAQASG
ncbi:Fucose permease [Andreprevotia lacus DSM 23236]|jgi:fucose permease|uniref:Fucose permease n=1 Tax=Andreprevotia lacus DSM 23236 TaxID=1121001 RepID=A0A1W1WWK2_9NEIS|nr:MFS transporter [Andreprevotia lacus]SMC16035.1 Fucose permease [Andreprevotia lacus DSM 23236]